MAETALEQLEQKFRTFLKPGNLIRDKETQKPFECDGLTMYREMPGLVVLPETVEEVQRILKLCHKHNVPVVPRGAGTGLTAGARPDPDAVLLVMTKFANIVHVDEKARQARVQPGVTNLSISQAVDHLGLYYAPDPSSQIACTIGGNIAENAGGVHCLKYGLTVHNILSVDFITMEGERVTFGGEGLDCPSVDMLSLFIGSEGLLGVVVEATIKLLPKPEVAQVVMAGFPSVEQAGDAVGRIIAEGIIPGGLEMMDSLAIQASEDFAKAGYPTEAEALLLCEVDGTREEVQSHIDRVQSLFKSLGAISIRISESEEDRQLLWKGRKSAFPAVGRISTDYYCMDGTIPRSRLAEVLTRMAEMSSAVGLRIANVFHAGDGNLHPLILFDGGTPGEAEKAEKLGADILKLCVEVGGCLTGEHGIGVEKMQEMPSQFGQVELEQFERIKAAFDPACLLNPGKGIPILKNCQEYKSLERAPTLGAAE